MRKAMYEVAYLEFCMACGKVDINAVCFYFETCLMWLSFAVGRGEISHDDYKAECLKLFKDFETYVLD